MDPGHAKRRGGKKGSQHVRGRDAQKGKDPPARDTYDKKKGDSSHDFSVHVSCSFLDVPAALGKCRTSVSCIFS
jgi:hypothetical protein